MAEKGKKDKVKVVTIKNLNELDLDDGGDDRPARSEEVELVLEDGEDDDG